MKAIHAIYETIVSGGFIDGAATLIDWTEHEKQQWLAIFSPNHFPMPPTVESVMKTWKDDYEFCRQFSQGINPFLIKVVNRIDEVPLVIHYRDIVLMTVENIKI